MNSSKTLTPEQRDALLHTLQLRFGMYPIRHDGVQWTDVQKRLEAHPEKLWSLSEMEATGGEPDVIGRDGETGEYLFCDCSSESPSGRRSACYDSVARLARKEHAPKSSALEIMAQLWVEILTESQYRDLQALGTFDAKTSSWIATPAEIRERGGALFADFRYGTTFVYHNGADSYYAARGARGCLRV